MDEHNNQNVYGEIEEKGNFGWAILGFFFPIIGLILYIVWKSEKPKDSKYAGVGALVSVICRALLIVLYIGIFYFALWPAVQGEIVQQTCSTYGKDYVAEKRGDNWGCRNTITNEYIDPDYSKSEENDYGDHGDYNEYDSSRQQSMNFRETLESENITILNENYEENKNQVRIILFRGEGCPHCTEFIQFLNSISVEYGDKFKLESYEVWNNEANAKLMRNVSSFMNKDGGGVPFIIIGDQVLVGYAESYNERIINLIKSEYAKDPDSRYDAIEQYLLSFDTKDYTDVDFD